MFPDHDATRILVSVMERRGNERLIAVTGFGAGVIMEAKRSRILIALSRISSCEAGNREAARFVQKCA
jgi:hypothetical protein